MEDKAIQGKTPRGGLRNNRTTPARARVAASPNRSTTPAPATFGARLRKLVNQGPAWPDRVSTSPATVTASPASQPVKSHTTQSTQGDKRRRTIPQGEVDRKKGGAPGSWCQPGTRVIQEVYLGICPRTARP